MLGIDNAIHFGSRPERGAHYTIRRINLDKENGEPQEIELVDIEEFEEPGEGDGFLAMAGWKQWKVPLVQKARITARYNGQLYVWRAWWPGLEGYGDVGVSRDDG